MSFTIASKFAPGKRILELVYNHNELLDIYYSQFPHFPPDAPDFGDHYDIYGIIPFEEADPPVFLPTM